MLRLIGSKNLENFIYNHSRDETFTDRYFIVLIMYSVNN